MTSVVTQNLSVSFAGRQVLKGVNLSLPARGLTVLAGPSGSGKTTFLRALNRLNEELGAETTGEVRLNLGSGLESIYGAGARDVTEIRRLAGMVFQTPNVLPASIWKNMALPLELISGLKRDESARRIEEALKAVGLWIEVEGRLQEQAESLSGGQQQRLCLARMLALEPRILLLDEPSASLDPVATGTVEKCLKDLSGKYPVIIVSHSLAQAWRLTDQLLYFQNGRFVKKIKREEAETEEDLIEHLKSLH